MYTTIAAICCNESDWNGAGKVIPTAFCTRWPRSGPLPHGSSASGKTHALPSRATPRKVGNGIFCPTACEIVNLKSESLRKKYGKDVEKIWKDVEKIWKRYGKDVEKFALPFDEVYSISPIDWRALPGKAATTVGKPPAGFNGPTMSELMSENVRTRV